MRRNRGAPRWLTWTQLAILIAAIGLIAAFVIITTSGYN
jgi:hypothetical protein